MHAVRMRKLTSSACPYSLPSSRPRESCSSVGSVISLTAPLVPTNFATLALSFGSQYVLPIVLNAAQLVVSSSSSYIPSGNATMLIDSAKVVINIATASLTTLRKNLADPPRSSAFLRKAEEDLSSDVLKIPLPRVGISGASGETAPTAMADLPVKDSVPGVSTPQ